MSGDYAIPLFSPAHGVGGPLQPPEAPGDRCRSPASISTRGGRSAGRRRGRWGRGSADPTQQRRTRRRWVIPPAAPSQPRRITCCAPLDLRQALTTRALSARASYPRGVRAMKQCRVVARHGAPVPASSVAGMRRLDGRLPCWGASIQEARHCDRCRRGASNGAWREPPWRARGATAPVRATGTRREAKASQRVTKRRHAGAARRPRRPRKGLAESLDESFQGGRNRGLPDRHGSRPSGCREAPA